MGDGWLERIRFRCPFGITSLAGIREMATCPQCGTEENEGVSACASCGTALQVQTAQTLESQPVAWTVLAAQGPLALGSSSFEYAVYDHDRTYGRWPNTPEGYRLASETFGAYAQSSAHGVAYSATGYRDPARLGLPTTPVVKSQTYAAPLSFVGSTRRILAWTKGTVERNPRLSVLLWILTVVALLITWAFVALWYSVVFGLFGIFMIPYRLIRRSQRKSLHVQQTALATQQAMFQQMTMMQQQAQPYSEVAPPPPSSSTPYSLPPG
jgi:hypothetical protein